MSEEFWAIIMVLLTNMVIILIFADLAFKFDKWWIVLFAALFVRGVKTKTIAGEEDSNGE